MTRGTHYVGDDCPGGHQDAADMLAAHGPALAGQSRADGGHAHVPPRHARLGDLLGQPGCVPRAMRDDRRPSATPHSGEDPRGTGGTVTGPSTPTTTGHPCTTVDDIRSAMQTLRDAHRTLICRPADEPAVRAAVERSPAPGLWDVQTSEFLPPGAVLMFRPSQLDPPPLTWEPTWPSL